ncbi:hypothetical protein C8F04DRAFT_1133442 [Mycena alexandri]|uniref:F-box domain-containing protein n=1 Tax=Mycena alexandri TaxID=1745969 RepID=A0AAD6WWM3_9AGAR|nr:hypothetical protein C8F04DRAFT_1133442 [Mycena alexandri]
MSSAFLCSKCGTTLSSGREALDFAVPPDRSLHRLAVSDVSPGSSEMTFDYSIVTKIDELLAGFDNEIAPLRNRLRQLEEHRAVLLNYRARTRAPLSPLRRMPPEVLGEIFSWTMSPVLDRLRRGRIDTSRSPWLLTQICSAWRRVAVSTPSLWSQVTIDYPESANNSSRYSLSLVEAQLERSNKLTVYFYGSEELDPSSQIQMFELLLQHASRWEGLSLGITSAIMPLLPTLRDRLSSLKHLWIQWDTADSQGEAPSIDCFQTSTSLIDVGICNAYRDVPIPFPAEQLTRYELNAPWLTHLGILGAAPGLVEAHIGISFDDEPWPESGERIELLQLRRLYVSNSRILDRLSAPALEELALECWGSLTTHIDVFFDRSSCRPRRLALTGTLPARATTMILQKFTSITEFTVEVDDSSSPDELHNLITLLSAPTHGEASAVVAPQLSRISFGCQHDTFVDYPLLLEMFNYRWRAPDCVFEHAALLTDSGPVPNRTTVNGLDALRREGLNLVVVEGVEARDEMHSWSFSTSW